MIISRKVQYKDVYRRTIEILQRARIFKANCCLKVHNAYLKFFRTKLLSKEHFTTYQLYVSVCLCQL